MQSVLSNRPPSLLRAPLWASRGERLWSPQGTCKQKWGKGYHKWRWNLSLLSWCSWASKPEPWAMERRSWKGRCLWCDILCSKMPLPGLFVWLQLDTSNSCFQGQVWNVPRHWTWDIQEPGEETNVVCARPETSKGAMATVCGPVVSGPPVFRLLGQGLSLRFCCLAQWVSWASIWSQVE